MRNNCFFILLLLLQACSTHYQNIPQSPPPIRIHSQELRFPQWFLNFPVEEHYTIGFAKKSLLETDSVMIESAKQSAAIFYSRSRASINIQKYAANYDAHASFRLIVSSEPEQLQNIVDSLQLVDSFFLNHYYIALFSLQETSLQENFKSSKISSQTLSQPNWFEGNKILQTNGVIHSYANASSSDLIDAWVKATEAALLLIADYVCKEVHSKHLMVDEKNYNFVSIETATILDEIKLQNIFVSSQIKDSLNSYSVFVRLTIH